MSTSDARALRAMEGHIVTVELRGGRRLDDCELVSSGRAGVQTLWLLVDGEDVLVPAREILWARPAIARDPGDHAGVVGVRRRDAVTAALLGGAARRVRRGELFEAGSRATRLSGELTPAALLPVGM